jgi:hypothetical protein
MRLISIVAGVVIALLTTSIVLGLLGLAGAPIQIAIILLALAGGIVAGIVAARGMERREDRLAAARGNAAQS